MGRTVVDIPYSDCANTVWRGQYFWRKNFYLAIMLSKAENRGGGHQGDGNTATRHRARSSTRIFGQFAL